MSRRRTYANDMKAMDRAIRRAQREQTAAHKRGEHVAEKPPACPVCFPAENRWP